MKRIILSCIVIFVSFATIVFARDTEIKIPNSLYKVSDYDRNIEIYHTERGVATLTVYGAISYKRIFIIEIT